MTFVRHLQYSLKTKDGIVKITKFVLKYKETTTSDAMTPIPNVQEMYQAKVPEIRKRFWYTSTKHVRKKERPKSSDIQGVT